MTDTDAVFETLAARRRRYVLYYLLEANDDVHLRDLAGLIGAAESGQPVVSVPPERRQRIAVELARTHLPMLEARGFVECESERVRLASNVEEATPYLELASQYELPPTAVRGDA